MRIPNLVLAFVLALMLPLEQAHCMWMGLGTHGTRVAATRSAAHACCKSCSPTRRSHESGAREPRTCLCEQLPIGVLPNLLLAGDHAPTETSVVMLAVPSVIAPASITSEAVPALDVGSPPLPRDLSAHGLRAPPASA